MPSLPTMNIGKKVMLAPIDQQDQVHLSDPLAQQGAGHLGEPVIDAGEEPEHAACEQRVVEVGHDEVRAVGLIIERGEAMNTPVSPPIRNWMKKASPKSIERAEHDRGADERADEVEILDPRRDRPERSR